MEDSRSSVEDSLIILKKHFSKEFIEELTKDCTLFYQKELRKRIKNPGYFNPNSGLGRYCSRNKDDIISKFLNYLFFEPNKDILIYIVKNLNKFKDKIFLDHGSGVNSFISIFLKKMGIKCYNHDNLSQIGNINLENNNYYKKYDILPPKDYSNIYDDLEIDVVVQSAGNPGRALYENNKKGKYFFVDTEPTKKYFDKNNLIEIHGSISIYKY